MIYFTPKLSIRVGGQRNNYTSPESYLNPSLKVQEGLKASLLQKGKLLSGGFCCLKEQLTVDLYFSKHPSLIRSPSTPY